MPTKGQPHFSVPGELMVYDDWNNVGYHDKPVAMSDETFELESDTTGYQECHCDVSTMVMYTLHHVCIFIEIFVQN